jgi:Outer membrane protein beta-barrel domain
VRNLIPSTVAALCLMLGSGVARGQDIGGGIKAGLNFATVSNADQTFSAVPQLVGGSVESGRLAAGAFLTWRFSNVFGVQPEILYSRQGAKGVTAGLMNVETTANIDMIEIPLLLRIGHKHGVFALAGPEFGFVAKAVAQTAGKGDVDFKSALKNSDTSLVIGGGAAMGWFLAEARYSMGLADINKNAGTVANKNQVFSILAGIQF